MNIDRTISFRPDMTDLILSGRKTLTIRPMKPQPELINDYGEDDLFNRYFWVWNKEDLSDKGREWTIKQYPHGRVGDVVSVRGRLEIRLKILTIQVMRVQDISPAIWEKDGVDIQTSPHFNAFNHWASFYTDSPYHWIDNPWCWIIEFEQVTEAQEKGNENQRIH